MDFILGLSAYLLYFIYDYNSITRKNRILQKFFLLGTLILTGSIVFEMTRCTFEFNAVTVFSVIGAVCFFALLVYTLFFAIPFKATYVSDSSGCGNSVDKKQVDEKSGCNKSVNNKSVNTGSLREAYTGGVYSLCRHPGVLWFAGMSVCLWLICRDMRSGIFFLTVTVGDILYVIYQDYCIFPKTFSNYSEYKKTTPFLIPGWRRKK